MKTKIILFCLFLSFNFSFKAQTYVTIPDANFVTWLQTNYPSCMNGNQMDIDCAEIQNTTFLDIHFTNISNLTGIQHFINLDTLYFSHNLITSLPILPNSLLVFSCPENQLTNIDNLPDSLISFYCNENSITNITYLPNTLQNFGCGGNLLLSLPYLPNSLRGISCISNQLTNLPTLPDSLLGLECSYNNLTNLPNLPNTLYQLMCSYNDLIDLPALSDSLRNFDCSNNNISILPDLPNKLELLFCVDNHIVILPDLPFTMKRLAISNNQISNINYLPNSIFGLGCSKNLLTSLPTLPSELTEFSCDSNQLISLPELPPNLHYLNCSSNNISCFPFFPNQFVNYSNYQYFNISNNPFTCLPNYINAMDSVTLTYPLCQEGDIINNPNNCSSIEGIYGFLFDDYDLNCEITEYESKVMNAKVKLYNSNDSLINQYISLPNGFYNYKLDSGMYKIQIDTIDLPYTFNCQNLDTSIILNSQNPLADNVNFALTCKPGFDVGVQSVLTNGWVFPGQNHLLKIIAGDLSRWYGLFCASGISGEVQISIDGPITYQYPSNGALIPIVSGNTFTYNISDFGSPNFIYDLGLIFKTDTTAQGGDEICVSINVTPTNGDNNMSNNTYEYCYQVVNSYDPNMKEVYPVNVQSGFDDYFTYTIHFQNTGSAPAFNIRLLDTLDANLDLETFQVTNYSHYNTAMVKNNILTFHFPNIMLQDSTTDLEGSKGFVQYRIKPKANLTLGTQIKNTANIYFDFNAPIVTNTTVNEYVQTNSISENESKLMNIFPNPFSSSTTIIFKNSLQHADLTLYTIFGQKVRTISDFSGDKLKLNRENLASGVYYLSLENENNSVETVKLVVGD
ncbi:MAG: T9SS type A sorting domain-containing protein [Bacteroidota bacterium]